MNVSRRHLFWIGLKPVSLAFLGYAVAQYASGGPASVGMGSPTWVTDMSDDNKLGGIVNNIWFGQVQERTGRLENKDDIPATYFKVSVLETLKGSLPSTIPVEQQGVDFADGGQFRISGDAKLLEPGSSYLFATSLDEITGNHVIVSGYGNLPLDVPKGAVDNQEPPPYG